MTVHLSYLSKIYSVKHETCLLYTSIMVPQWIRENCIQCNQCSLVCPHATIRPFLLTNEELSKAPDTFVTKDANGPPVSYTHLDVYKRQGQFEVETIPVWGVVAVHNKLYTKYEVSYRL